MQPIKIGIKSRDIMDPNKQTKPKILWITLKIPNISQLYECVRQNTENKVSSARKRRTGNNSTLTSSDLTEGLISRFLSVSVKRSQSWLFGLLLIKHNGFLFEKTNHERYNHRQYCFYNSSLWSQSFYVLKFNVDICHCFCRANAWYW